MVASLASRGVRRFATPKLTELADAAAGFFPNVQAMAEELRIPWDARASDVFGGGQSKDQRAFPAEWDSGTATSDLLNSVILSARPRLVVETGIANGVSTNAELDALLEVGKGRLVSFDIDPNARGSVTNPEAQALWDCRILPLERKPRIWRRFEADVSEMGQVDLWYHDGDHSWRWQGWEYSLALRKLSSTGILISDDIDASYAWLTVMASAGVPWYAAIDQCKVIGITGPGLGRLGS